MSGLDKGKAFERKVVNILRSKFNFKKTECYRTPISGGHPFTYRSDITFTDEIWHKIKLFIECKYRAKTKEWSVSDILEFVYDFSRGYNNKKVNKWKPIQWLEKMRKNCPDWGVPVLAFGLPRSKIFILMNNDIVNKYKLDTPLKISDYYSVFIIDDFLKQWKNCITGEEK